MTRKVNEVQMGGTHYQGKSISGQQHWDVAYDFNFDPGQYNVTKYVMRHADKNGFEDLTKCFHHLVKYMEVRYPVEMLAFNSAMEKRSYKKWENSDGAELPTWLIERVQNYLRDSGEEVVAKVATQAVEGAAQLNFVDGGVAEKCGDLLRVTCGMREAQYRPIDWLDGLDGKEPDYLTGHIRSMRQLHPLLQNLANMGIGTSKTRPLIEISDRLHLLESLTTLTKHEASIVRRVFEAGNITVLKPEDDAARKALMERLGKHYNGLVAPERETVTLPRCPYYAKGTEVRCELPLHHSESHLYAGIGRVARADASGS